MIIERLEDLVETAIQLGWKPNVKNLWSKWLDEVTVDIKHAERLRSLLMDIFPTEEMKLRCLTQWGFISTEAEEFVANNKAHIACLIKEVTGKIT